MLRAQLQKRVTNGLGIRHFGKRQMVRGNRTSVTLGAWSAALQSRGSAGWERSRFGDLKGITPVFSSNDGNASAGYEET